MAIPPLLVIHILGTRVAHEVYGFDDSYLAVLMGAQQDPYAARAALFQAATAGAGPSGPTLPPICDVLGRLGRTCEP